jgi:hypothetical protein
MNSQPDTLRVKGDLREAIEITSTDEGQVYMNGTCNGNSSLLAPVQTLLRAHSRTAKRHNYENKHHPDSTNDIGRIDGAFD